MPKKYAELLLVGAFFVVAVLLYGSTASYPNAVQGSTAAYVRFLAMCRGALCVIELGLFILRSKKQARAEQMACADGAQAAEKPDTNFHIAKNPKPFWALFLVLVLYSASLSYVGFYIASAVFLPVTMFILGARKPLTMVLTTIGVLGFVYGVFEKVLEVYLPVGSLIHFHW